MFNGLFQVRVRFLIIVTFYEFGSNPIPMSTFTSSTSSLAELGCFVHVPHRFPDRMVSTGNIEGDHCSPQRDHKVCQGPLGL